MNICEKCFYYGTDRNRYHRCNFDGTYNPYTKDGECEHFIPLETFEEKSYI